MKKHFLVILFCCGIISYAQSLNFSPLLSDISNTKFDIAMYSLDDTMFNIYRYNAGKLYYRYSIDLKLNQDSGYLYNSYILEGTDSLYRDYLILGEGIIIRDQNVEEKIAKVSLTDFQKSQENYWNNIKKTLTEGERERIYYFPVKNKILNIESSSFLKEGNVLYTTDNLSSRLYLKEDIEETAYFYDTYSKPWVEGKSDYGIGEWLNLTFDGDVDQIQVLNGYVDLRRKYLYKENSRVKKLRVEGDDFSFDVDFEDVVKYTVIKFPSKTTHVKLTILDVYKGDKYSDTCISSIIAQNSEELKFDEQLNSFNEMSRR